MLKEPPDGLARILARTPAVGHLLAGARAGEPVHACLLEVEDLAVGRAAAELFLTALYCPVARETGVGCGTCPDCVQVTTGTHPGVVPVEPDGNEIRVEDVRGQVLDRLGERVPGGRPQVFVLHGAELLNEESGNALLKAVEEPPPRTLFLLLTRELEAVLETIRSRCRELVVRLPPLGRLLAGLGSDLAYPAGAVLAAGPAPGLLADLARAPQGPVREGSALDELAARGGADLEGLEEAALLRDPRASAHRGEAADRLLAAAVELLEGIHGPLKAAGRMHAFVDACAGAAKKRGAAIGAAFEERHGEGFKHPALKRDGVLARQASTRAAEDLLRALAAAAAAALSRGAGRDPFGLAGRHPGLARLATRPPITLLAAARRARQAREPLARNQNMRLLFDELAGAIHG